MNNPKELLKFKCFPYLFLITEDQDILKLKAGKERC